MRQLAANPAFRFNLVWLALALALPLLAVPVESAHADGGVGGESAAAESLREAVLEVTVNGQAPGEMLVVLRDGADQLWLDESDFARLRLRTPADAARLYQQRRYLPLSGLGGLRLAIDEQHQSAAITLPPSAFLPTRISVSGRDAPAPATASLGAYANYQLSLQRIAGESLGGGYAELGVFGPVGVLNSSGLARRLAGQSDAVRLDTTFTHDYIARIERLTLGDAISDGGSWGSAVRFAGLSWGKNFSLRPDLLTTPLLSASGSATVPSTVDIYVNNQKVSSESLPPGPFIIDRLPAVTGAGEVSLVVRDALGREQLLTRPFYSSIQQLAAGISQYQVDVGRIRRDYTLASNRYGALLASGSYRRGLSDVVTLEAHGEFLEHAAHGAGLTAATAIGHLGLFNVTAAAGGDAQDSGSLLGAGLERHGNLLSVTANRSVASVGYRQVAGSENPYLRFHVRDLLQLGVSLRRAGSVSLAYVRQSSYVLPALQTASVSYSRNIGEYGAVNLTATRTSQAGEVARSVFLTYTLSLDQRRAVVLSANGGSGPGSPDDELYATYVQNPPLGPGAGYRVGASSAGNYDAQWRDQLGGGDLDLQAARNHGVAGTSLFWSGAATLLGGELRAARQVNSSFALVDVAGLANVPVYVDNQLVAHTDASGRALIRDLQAYEPNRIGIDPTELPLDTTISARTMVLVPAYRSGVIARFPVERVAGGTFRLVTSDGQPVPAGAQVRFNGAYFPVTFDGMTYVTGFDHGMAGEARWGDSHCVFRLEPPPPGDPLPDMGTIVCRVPSIAGRP